MKNKLRGQSKPRLRLHVTAAAETQLRAGYPWVFGGSVENVLPELKTVLPNARLRRGFRLRQGSGGQVGRQADFVIEGYVDPPTLR